MIRVFAHVLAEEFLGVWFAWFRNQPESVSCGHSPEEAFRRLFEAFHVDEFDCGDFIPLEQLSPDGHRQFLIAHRQRIVIPSTSVN